MLVEEVKKEQVLPRKCNNSNCAYAYILPDERDGKEFKLTPVGRKFKLTSDGENFKLTPVEGEEENKEWKCTLCNSLLKWSELGPNTNKFEEYFYIVDKTVSYYYKKFGYDGCYKKRTEANGGGYKRRKTKKHRSKKRKLYKKRKLSRKRRLSKKHKSKKKTRRRRP